VTAVSRPAKTAHLRSRAPRSRAAHPPAGGAAAAKEASRLLAEGRAEAAVVTATLALANSSAEMSPNTVAKLLHARARAEAQVGRLSAARESLLRALEIPVETSAPEQVRAHLLVSLAEVERDFGDLPAAREHGALAVELCRRAAGPDDLARALVDLALTVKDQADTTGARALLEDALEVVGAGSPSRDLGNALYGLGQLAQLVNDDDAALSYMRRARMVYRRAGDRNNEAITMHAIGSVYYGRGAYRLAARRYRRALRMNRALGFHAGVAECLSTLAGLDADRGRIREAVEGYARALVAQRRAGLTRDEIHTLIDLGVLARDGKAIGQADEMFTRAVTLAERLGDPGELLDVHTHIGDLRAVEERWDDAVASYEQAVAAIDDARGRVLAESDALGYFDEDALAAFDRLVLINGWRARPLDALRWAEEAKGAQFRQLLATAPLHMPPAVPAALADADRRAAAAVRAAAARMTETAGQARAEAAAAYLQARERLTVLWQAAAEAGGPGETETAVATVAELRSAATPGSERPPGGGTRADDLIATARRTLRGGGPGRVVAVEIHLAENTAVVFGLASDSAGPDVVSVEDVPDSPPGPAHRSVDGAGSTWTGALAGVGDPGWLDALRSILSPVLEWARPGDHVCLIPHGRLHGVPLHAVDLGDGALIDRHPVSYAPSLAALRYCQARHRPGRINRESLALVLADAGAGGPLPFARAEALAVAAMFTRSRVSWGRAATADALWGRGRRGHVLPASPETRVPEPPRGPAPDVVHLAVHGLFGSGAGPNTGVLLADGMVAPPDIAATEIAAELVALTACDSGRGDRLAGDEVVGLTRAVLLAGAAAALVSLWNVGDLPTAIMAERFYAELLDGADKAEALRRACLALRSLPAAQAVEFAARVGRELAETDEAGDSTAAVRALDLTIAHIRFRAGDYAAAAAAYEELALTGTPAERDHAAERAQGARLLARAVTGADYGRQLFASPRYWAPFVLTGDWR
jgi:CHAT domain-containing protein/tetratricopeptide (TPR) repeat protein